MIPNNDCLVHIANLPEKVHEKFIFDFFHPKVVEKVIIKQRASGIFAFVQFKTPEDAEAAVEDFNYTKINGVPITITHATALNLKSIKNNLGTVFIKGLDKDLEESQLHGLFSNFGPIISCRVPMDGDHNRGFGYIQFVNPEDADEAISQLDGAEINGSPISVEKYFRRFDSKSPVFINRKNIINETFTTVFVRNLPSEIDSFTSFVELFAEYGTVTSANFIKEKNAGFCKMSDHISAVKAMNGLNGRTIGGKTLVTCRALTHEERIAYQHLKEQQDM